jgi:phage tail sheath protein FI
MGNSYASPGVYVEEVPSAVKPIAGASTSTPVFVTLIADGAEANSVPLLAKVDASGGKTFVKQTLPPSKTISFFTNWTAFAAVYGGLVGDPSATAVATKDKDGKDLPAPVVNVNQHNLALAVYGFFNNGGSQCYVVRAKDAMDFASALTALEAIEDISLVIAPGITDDVSRAAIIAHCAIATGNRFAILDADASATVTAPKAPANSDYAAYYYPAIQVFDPSAALAGGSGVATCPPSGHIAGVYARVDAARGVHKAPANEVIAGALDVSLNLSKGDRDKLNPDGVNCLRTINGNVVVWGARTVGGDDNADLKYINVRRTLIYLRKSIEDGTQWIVFEPNTPALWQKINRNVGAFLTEVWRSGALFGSTAKEAFYVKCDAENNPPASRDNGFVVTEIGVALAKPAEFVVFRISQYSGSGA